MKKFVVTSKETISITLSIQPNTYKKLSILSEKSKRSKNELVNRALKYAFEKLEFKNE